MSKSVRLSDELVDLAKEKAALYHRSPPQQIEHWAQIGRVMESALSYKVEDKVNNWGTAEDIDDLLDYVASPEGQQKDKAVINQFAGTLYAVDPQDSQKVIQVSRG